MLEARELHRAEAVAKTCRWQERVQNLGEELGANPRGARFPAALAAGLL